MSKKISCQIEIFCKDCKESLAWCSEDMYFVDVYFQCFDCAEKEDKSE